MKNVTVISFQSLTSDYAEGMAKVGYELSRVLHDNYQLKEFIVSSKGPHKTPFPSRNASLLSRASSLIFRHLENLKIFKTHRIRYWKEVLFDYSCSRLINSNTEILISTNAFMPRTFQIAKRLGIKVILVPGNPEEGKIREIVFKECQELSLVLQDAYTDNKRYANYIKAMYNVDVLFGFTNFISSSYKERFENIKIINIPSALSRKKDLSYNHSIPKNNTKNSSGLKVGFLAYSVLLKGLHRLIDAWLQIHPNEAYLKVAGPIDSSISSLIEKKLMNATELNIELKGKIDNLDEFFNEIDLLIVPSLIDGSPLTIIEALQRGVPVLTTRNCGYSQFITSGLNGLVVDTKFEDLLNGLQLILDKRIDFANETLPQQIYSIEDFATTIRNELPNI